MRLPMWGVVLPAVCAVMFVPGGAFAQGAVSHAAEPGPEAKLVIAAVRLLERDPLGDGAAALRGPLMAWLVRTPDLELRNCSGLAAPFANGSRPYDDELKAQQLLASAAYMLEHPDSASNAQAAARAGLLGCLRAYENIVRMRPDVSFPELDELIEQRDYGDFDAVIAAMLARCE